MRSASPAATTGLPASAEAAGARAARRITGLRRNSVAISVMLLFQYGLGMGINLYVSVPVTGSGGMNMSHLPTVVIVHAAFGLFLLVAGISVLTRAILVRHPLMIATSAAGLLAILGAGAGGAVFTGNGQDSASMVMAILTGVALLCYLLNVSLCAGAARAGAGLRGAGPARGGG